MKRWQNLQYISSKIHKDIFAIPNYIDDLWEYYIFVSFTEKSNTGYHTFKGICISDEVNRLNQNSFNEEIFIQKLEKLHVDEIRFPYDNWYWFRSEL